MNRMIPSCDTLAALGSCTATGCNILAKNSDRDLVESQPLIAFPAADHAPGEKVQCTYIAIDQVPLTNRMIGSKPWWIWGFEHGVNEYGVGIGNEAAWSTMPVEQENGLLGMDLLRLGLERGKTAYEAMHVITGLLEKYGQGGACIYGGTIQDFAYHNLFLIADRKEIWLLETVCRHWVAKKVTDAWCISNIYTIEEDFDECSEGLVEYAIEHGLHTPGEPFNFSKSFILFQSGFMSGHPRHYRMKEFLKKHKGSLAVEDFWSILRDHFEGTVVEPRFDPASVCDCTICMHGEQPGACITAASIVLEMHDSKYPELFFTYWGSMCPPCASFMIPFYNTGYIPEKLGKGTNKYSDDSFWWKVYRLNMGVEANYGKYIGLIQEARTPMEKAFRIRASETESKAAELLAAGKAAQAAELLNSFTDQCLEEVEEAVDRILAAVEADLALHPGQPYRQKYLAELKAKVEL
ncbi:MAG: C69 family dipeptidase [Oscillospiraceae bacterium]|nr:C69 family dipeptidase [Oscillospiraceae bacterium]